MCVLYMPYNIQSADFHSPLLQKTFHFHLDSHTRQQAVENFFKYYQHVT